MLNASKAFPVLLALGAALMPRSAMRRAQPVPAPAQSALKSVSIDLPNGDRMFPAGTGAEAINNNCLACHSAGMVLNQPAMPKAAWESEVNKMINAYKAPVAARGRARHCRLPRQHQGHEASRGHNAGTLTGPARACSTGSSMLDMPVAGTTCTVTGAAHRHP